jgi:transcriptional regulator with XRE-family HTH domain
MEINFSETLKNLRREHGNTQEELATHLGISVQAVSKWERGDGMPDVMLLPHIASFYDTTVDFLLGCDSVRKQKDMEVFKEKAHDLINKGKRAERLELCRAYQKKYPSDETVLYSLMHDLFSVDCKGNSEEIISIANKLLKSGNTEYHFGAVQLLALTNSRMGNYNAAVEYASRFPANRDILRCVLKGEDLVEHCKWEWTQVNGVNGAKVIGPNGSCIFLPAAGGRDGSSLFDDGDYGYYWTSTPYGIGNDDRACGLDFDYGFGYVDWGYYRRSGLPVRPITE